MSCYKNSVNGMSEALVIGVVKINWLLGRLWVYGFDRHINLWQEYQMVARRRLIDDSRVKLDEAHNTWSIKLQTKEIRARCSKLSNEEILSIEADAIENIEDQCLH